MSFPVVPQNVQMNPNAPADAAASFMNSFNDNYKKARVSKALTDLQSGDKTALNRLMEIDPQLGMRVQEQMREQEERARAAASRTAMGEYVIASNPNDPNVRAAVEAGADPKELVMTNTRQSKIGGAQLKNIQLAHDGVMQIVASVSDQAGYDAAKQRAREIYGSVGLDVSYIDTLPSLYSPDVKRQLLMEGMKTTQQLGHIVSEENNIRTTTTSRENNIRSTDTSRENNIRSTSTSRENNIRSTETSSENNQRSTATSTANNVRSNQQSNTNSERSAETTRGSATYRGRGRNRSPAGNEIADGTVARNKNDGKLYVRRGGQWVPK